MSGCPIDCAESKIRDIGVFAQGKSKWVLMAGGNVGSRPRLAVEITRGLDDEAAMEAISRLVLYYKENAKKGERMGKMIERIGVEPLQEMVSDLSAE